MTLSKPGILSRRGVRKAEGITQEGARSGGSASHPGPRVICGKALTMQLRVDDAIEIPSSQSWHNV